LVNRDAPGFEQVENAMMLDTAPAGEVPADIEVTSVLSLDDVDAAHRVMEQAFGLPDGTMDSLRDAAWAHAQDAAYPMQRVVARLDGAVVGTAIAATAPAGVNLFGGAVLESARGRGVYRAMVARRWQSAVERGTPALTVQAGRMSRPVLERLGFRVLGQFRVFDDEAISS
jgi:GNAT superfamily N-acetyltransferase